MAYASITYTSASGTTFALTNSSGDPIEYLRQNDISVTVNGVLKTLTTDYTFNSAGTAIVLNTAVSGATVIIARTTDIADATVSFTAGSTLTAQDLNNSDKQNRFALQEFSDIYGALTTGTGDLSALGGFIGSAETWLSDNAHAPTTGAVDTRVDSKIDTALTTDVVAGDSITVTDNSPSSGQITIGVTNASISTTKLVDSSVTTAKIADGNVTTAKILDANVTTAKILDANVTTAKIADSAVTSAKIADGTIVAGDIASDAVTTAKILDSNVTTGKIADLAVTTAKLADSSVTSAKIVDGTIVAGDLASDSVTTAKIVDSNVTTAKINDSAVTTGKIADSAVTAIKIADGVITSAKLNAATVVTAAEQAACTPDDVTFFTTSASDGRYVNVTGDSMTGALAMGSNKITDLGTPTANTDAATKLYVDNSVAAGVGDADYGDITVSGTGTVWTIDSGVVTSAKIADGTIVDGDINAAAAIDKTKISGTAITAADTGTVTSTMIADGAILNADVNAAAAIAGTKISPDFGSQNVTTTGTVTGASLSPTSSTVPSNGVYLPAANSVAISTGGSGRLFVDSTGRIGVGTNTPSTVSERVIHIYAGAGASSGLRVTGNAGTGLDLIHGTDGSGYLYQRDNAFLAIGTNNTERLRITSAGLVGVGTSTFDSSALLFVSSPSTAVLDNSSALFNQTNPAFIQIKNNTDDIADPEAGIIFQPRNTQNGAVAVYAKRTGGFTSDLLFRFRTGSASSAEVARFTSTGRLGIGDSAPTARLVCNGSIQITSSTNPSTGAGLEIGYGTVNASRTALQSYNRTGSAWLGADYNALDHRFYISGGGSPQMTLTSTGLGIGTTPSNTLDVNGTARFRLSGNNLVVTTEGGAPYLQSEQNAPIHFGTNSQLRATIDSSGRLLVGTSTNDSNFDSKFQIAAGDATASSLLTRFSANSGGPVIYFGKSRSATVGTKSLVSDGDTLGGLEFYGSGAANWQLGAKIEAQVDGTPESGGDTSDMPGRLVFSTTADGASSPTERMSITKEGNTLTCGATVNNPGAGNTNIGLVFENAPDGATVLVSRNSNAVLYLNRNSDGSVTQIQRSGVGVGSIAVTTSATSFNTSSDYRLKENVVPLIGAIDRLNQLQVHRFNFIADPDTTVDGFIAHEAQAVVPECVTGTKDEVDADGNPVYQGIDQSKLVPLLTAALQEALAEIESLKARVTALEP